MADAPLPNVTDPHTAPFWKAARENRLIAQRCPCCEAVQWPPKPNCTACLTELGEADWTEIARTGTVWSFLVYHRAFHPGFADRVPYNVAMVRLDAGPMFITNVTGGNDLAVGDRVTAAFEAESDEVTLVRFRRLD
jgi:uncharacterized OB-fold protein